MFDELRQHPDLFDPFRAGIAREVDTAIARTPYETAIDSARLGKSVLENIGSWWHGEFPRRFPGFPNGASRGLTGMTLWNYLAAPNRGWWSFSGVEDPHGYGESHMLYVQLRQGDPRIPTEA